MGKGWKRNHELQMIVWKTQMVVWDVVLFIYPPMLSCCLSASPLGRPKPQVKAGFSNSPSSTLSDENHIVHHKSLHVINEYFRFFNYYTKLLYQWKLSAKVILFGISIEFLLVPQASPRPPLRTSSAAELERKAKDGPRCGRTLRWFSEGKHG